MRRSPTDPPSRPRRTTALVAVAALSLVACTPTASGADAPAFPSDAAKPDLVPLLSGYDGFWKADAGNTLHGTPVDARTLGRDDELAVWINRHATEDQRFRALQDAEYDDDGTGYDQSVTISDGLGSVLGPAYVRGRRSGALPLTSALINSENGTAGAYVSTSAAKARFSHPRPYVPADPAAQAPAGDEPACAPAKVNASSLRALRAGRPYATAAGSLRIERVPDVVDRTHAFSSNDVPLGPGYGTAGLCTGGSFPSGHTTTAYEAGITLATLLPELAPTILARASEAGNNRIVLGVHYPLDVVGGRISGQAALAARWSDAAFRDRVLEPARRELRGYLERACGAALNRCVARQRPYRDVPYGGRRIPGGTAQVVVDRRSAARVYRERLTYGFGRVGPGGRAASVPAGAENLLRTAFPTLSAAQRTAVLAQTEVPSGFPLDGTGTSGGSWQRLDLGAALSATVLVTRGGSARVLGTGGAARVRGHGAGHPDPAGHRAGRRRVMAAR